MLYVNRLFQATKSLSVVNVALIMCILCIALCIFCVSYFIQICILSGICLYFIQECISSGSFAEPKGYLHKEFWRTKFKGIACA